MHLFEGPWNPELAERLSSYLDESDEEPRAAALEELLNYPRLVSEWYGTILRLFEIFFQAQRLRFEAGGPAQQAWLSGFIERWNELAVNVAPRNPRLAEDFYWLLLRDLRDAQEQWGRISKGLAYHQIGWAKLLAGDEAERAEAEGFFVTAFIEDLLDSMTEVDNDAYRKPAAEVLRLKFQKSSAFFEDIEVFLTRQLQESVLEWNELVRKNAEFGLLDYLTAPFPSVAE